MSPSDLGLSRRTLITRGPDWAAQFPVDTESITLDADKCLAVYTDGVVPSGAFISKVTATGLYAPFLGLTDEVQLVTEGGTGLTSFTLTYSGQTTTSLAANATAAQVQAALVALSNIGDGDVLVTGVAGGPYTVTFGGALADTNVAQMTATPTGGTGTVTVTTSTGGGTAGAANGQETAGGLLLGTKTVRAGYNVDGAIYYKGRVYEDLLPARSRLDLAAAKLNITQIRFSKVGG